MREIRSSGSVEGVVSNRDPYSDTSNRSVLVGNVRPNFNAGKLLAQNVYRKVCYRKS